MAYRNPKSIMPSVDDYVMQVLGMSEALCREGIITDSKFDRYRPTGWPESRTFLTFYGFDPTPLGWRTFVDLLIVERENRPKWCRNCGDPRIWCRGRCRACDRYYRRTDKERPRRLWNRHERKCKNCKIPIAALPRLKRGEYRQYNGRCQSCHSYWRKWHRERPREFWGIGPAGWCECGYPATATVEGMPVCNRHRE